MKILFICTGNTCRSPMAEGIMRELAKRRGMDIEVESAGVLSTPGTPATNFAKLVLEDMGMDIKDKTAQLVTTEMIESSDLILVMTEKHKQFFNQFHDLNIYTVGEYIGTNEVIRDPYGGDMEVYRDTAYQLYSSLEKVLDIISGEDKDMIHDVNIF
ncbi:MAG: low molecular weight protein arginine phosphatase [Oscillospiraceae bacterium]|nr:low molecular weight protein arginine phosphatase [Oscillospiraceae bacterium]